MSARPAARQDRPSDHIRGLVCGLPKPHRDNRLLLMLKAYIDDSISSAPPVFVLGGYIAPAEAWARFSDAWQKILDIPPKLDYFKMNEAWALRGQFAGWSAERRDERLGLLYAVIEAHVSAEFFIGFRPDVFNKVYAHFDKKGRNPYYFATARLMADLGRGLEKLGLPIGPIDFIFDTQTREKRHVIWAWELGYNISYHDPPELKQILSNAPSFHDDKEILPLQAADFFVWWMRRQFVEQIEGRPLLLPPVTPTRSIPRMDAQYDEERLRKIAWSGKLRAKIGAKLG